jgi:hypothetical protein
MEFAEELAIEYMDAHHGPRSGNFQSQQTASQTLNACLSTLAEQIGKSHNIPPRELLNFFGRRSLPVDIAASLPFILLYCVLAAVLGDWVRRRYPPEDGWMATLIMVTLCSSACGVCGMLLGEQWSTLAENIRVGTGHLSYRMDRLPWVRYHVSFFVLCAGLFWCVTAARYRIRR